MFKKELRKLYKTKRAALSFKQINKMQQNIYAQVQQLDVAAVNYVHVFLSIKHHKELDTAPLISYFRSKNKHIVVSKCNFTDHTLTHFLLENNTVLKPNKFGVLEPVNAKEVSVKQLDLIFVPLLISDKNNYRVGYGKGFYDRFLSECSPKTQCIGLNFFKPIANITDTNSFDIALDRVIYPV